jgi:hypothetical protein
MRRVRGFELFRKILQIETEDRPVDDKRPPTVSNEKHLRTLRIGIHEGSALQKLHVLIHGANPVVLRPLEKNLVLRGGGGGECTADLEQDGKTGKENGGGSA